MPAELRQHVAALLLEARGAGGRQENGTPFIVLELLQGCDLAPILEERGRVEPAECVDWILQATAHRNLKWRA